MREGDRWMWGDDPRFVRNLEIEVIGGRIMVTRGRGSGDVWSPTLDRVPNPSAWEYAGNFSKSDNFNNLYNKLNEKEL